MSSVDEPESSGLSSAVLVTMIALIGLAVTGGLWYSTGNGLAAIGCLLFQTILVSIIIWQACDPFAEAAQYLGHLFRLPGSVRGATLDAIASSMPELFTGIFFVIVAAMGTGPDSLSIATGEGFKDTIATCAGSAVYNMILIPAICALVISVHRKSRPTIDVERKVITRDGLWFVVMEVLLIIFLFQQEIEWWMGMVFLVAYAAYVLALYLDTRRFQRQMRIIEQKMEAGLSAADAIQQASLEGVQISRDLESRFAKGNPLTDEQDDPGPDRVEVLFGAISFPLTHAVSWLVILVSTVVAACACYWLVEITQQTAIQLEVPVFFVAVILAAAASSVPDTFLSIGSARKGDDDGAVSNAFGSNIFDISICISIPLLVASYLNGWEPITVEESGAIVGLQLMLAVLTVITLLVIWHRLQLTRVKAVFLCFLYVLFIGYAVLGSLGILGPT